MRKNLWGPEEKEPGFRKRAKELFAESSEHLNALSTTDVQSFIHELYAHPAELGTPNRILLIEDNPADVRLVQEMLSEARNATFKLEHAGYLSTGLKLLAEEKFDLLLLDLNLPDSYGLETFEKAQTQAPGMPIIAMTSLEDESLAIRALQLGAQDYLVKGKIDSNLLVRSILYSLGRKRAEDVLRKALENLEVTVQERTAELLKTNEKLRNEIIERGRAEERFRLVTESASNAIVIANRKGEITLINSQAEKIFGYRREELLGKQVEILVPERFRSKHPEYRMSFYACPQARPMGAGRDLYALRKDGSEFPVEIGLNPIQTDEGVLVLSSIVDITERKRAEEALKRRTEQVIRYQSVLLELAKIENSDLDSALKRITEIGSKTLGVERVGVWLFNKDHAEIVCKDLYKLGENLHENGLILKAKDYPRYFEALEKSRILSANDSCADPRTSEFTEGYLKPYGIASMMDVPVRLQGNVVGIVCHEHTGLKREWTLAEEDFAASIADMVSLTLEASDRIRADLELQRAFSEIKQLKDQLERENIYLREEIKLESSYDEIVGASCAIKSVLSQAEQVANTGATVLLYGETGTGKELIARAIHKLSPRRGRALVKVNCAALPSTLIEAELFGREKGAYTGALTKQIGRFEMANGSTIFLDEISELSLELQSKLLRVLQEGEFERLGSPQTIKVDVRVIAATNRDLSKAMEGGSFREDLFYRLNIFPIHIPPLRERREDIPMLVWSFIKEFSEKMGKRIEKIPRKTMEALQLYPWYGNVRELRNVIERAMILTKDTMLLVDLPKNGHRKSYQSMTLEDMERKHILEVMEATNWRIRGSGGASEVLGLKPSTLESKMIKLDIKRGK